MSSSIDGSEECRYSVAELLRLRSALPIVKFVVDKLNKHGDIASIVRVPEAAIKHPQRFSCTTSSLIDATNERGNRLQARQQSSEPSEGCDQPGTSLIPIRQPQPVHWNLRRRDSSDNTSQPHSAPTSSVAQQSENFQRFYRAVVSPTHVRVTAGGRIVPNTRVAGTPAHSPQEWNAEKHYFEPKKSDSDLNGIQAVNWLHTAPPPPGFPPLFPAPFVPPHNFNLPGNTVSLPAMPPPQPVNPPTHDQDMADHVSSLQIKGDAATTEQQPQGVPQPIKISPPTQFDQTKPFMYNGQLVYPVPPPGAIPVAMLGNPNFGHPISANNALGGFPLPHFPMPLANLANPLLFPPGQQHPMMLSHALSTPEGGSAMTPFGPALLPSVVPVSDITKTQIQSLRNHVQLIDSQIANNTNQNHEAFLSLNRNAILTQIGQMEMMLQGQLAQENITNATMLGNENKSMIRNSSLMITKNEKKAQATFGGQGHALPSKHSSARSSTDMAERPGKTNNDSKDKMTDAKSTIRGDPTSKSRLTAAAAMAPPFQPRAQAAVVQPQAEQMSMALVRMASPDEKLPFETQAQIETRLLSKASTNWSTHSTFPRGSAPGGAPASIPRAHSMQEPPHVAHTRRMLPRSSTFHGQTELPPSTLAPLFSAQAVPYLVGVLPQNIRNGDAKPSDIIYPRPLTDEEVRARHLYWGNAPRSIQKGLPKFDGKDFYPPSPVKEVVQIVHNDVNVVTHGEHDSQTVPVLDFENLFTEPGVPGYKSPVQLSANQPNLHRAPVKPSTNGTGLRIHETGSHTSWSTRNARAEDHNYRPVTPPRSSIGADAPASDDFSHLFLERGVPGYKSPSPPRPASKRETTGFSQACNAPPATPKNVETFGEANGDDDETRTVDSWGFPTAESRWNGEEGCVVAIGDDVPNDEQSNSSTVEIHLTPPIKEVGPKPDLEGSFQERVASFSNAAQQTLFLQNMLKSTSQPSKSMTGSVLSGAVSSATAIGYLPQYRGSAAASLAPTILNVPAIERELERPLSKADPSLENANASATFAPTNFLPENRPLSQDRSQHSARPSPDSAEGYMRFLTQKADEEKKITEPYTNTVGSSPFIPSDW